MEPIALAAARSRPQSTDTSSGSNNSMTEIAQWAKILLGAYRTGEANDAEVYTAHIVRVLSGFPLEVVKRAATRIPDTIKWLPSPSEVKAVCKEIYRPIVEEAARQRRIEEQLADRARLTDMRAKQPREPYKPAETIEVIRARESERQLREQFGLSQADWDALPNQPQTRMRS